MHKTQPQQRPVENVHSSQEMKYLSYPSPQVSITCRYYVALMLPYPITEAVIGIGATVYARQALYARVLHSNHTY